MNPRTDDAGVSPGAHAMADLVQYQPGSVVSRTLIKKPTGTVTMFAFDAGEGLSEHAAPFDALVVGVDGAAQIHIDGVPHAVRAGETLLLPAGHPHAVRAVERFKMMLVMIREPRQD
jgi:quercetin dioxygenase-like cupin family protein